MLCMLCRQGPGTGVKRDRRRGGEPGGTAENGNPDRGVSTSHAGNFICFAATECRFDLWVTCFSAPGSTLFIPRVILSCTALFLLHTATTVVECKLKTKSLNID